MSISRVSGRMLQDNLQRDSNLAIATDVVFVDVINNRLGVNTTNTTQTLSVAGNARVGNFVIDTNSISSLTGNIVLAPAGNIDVSNIHIGNLATPVANSDASTKYYVDYAIDNAYFTVTDGANSQRVYTGNVNTLTVNSVANQTSVVVSATDSLTIGLANSISISGTFTASGNINGGNITTIHQVVATGNIVGGNLTTPGEVVAIGNISGANLDTNGNVVATGNVLAANLNTTGNVVATGNIVGGNLDTNGNVVATGNVIGGNLTTVGNVVGGNLTTVGDVTAVGNIVATGNIIGGNLDTDGNIVTIGNITAGNLLSLGSVDVGTITIANSSITSSDNLTFIPLSNTGVVQINSTTGLTLPVGNSFQRPLTPDLGSLRFNTDDTLLEIWDGTGWQGYAVSYAITQQLITPNGVDYTYTLNSVTRQEAILVQLNGVGQIPGYAYTVDGDQITFAEPPQPTDQVEIRFLTGVSSSGSVIQGNAQRLAFYPTTQAVVSDSGPNLTWNGSNLLTVGGNISAGYFVGNGSQLTGLPASYSDANVATYLTNNPPAGTYGNANVGSYLPTYSGNLSSGNLSVTRSISTTGNVSVGNLSISGTTTAGNISTPGTVSAGNVIVSGSLYVAGNLSYLNVSQFSIQDPIIDLGSAANLAPLITNDGYSRGLKLHYYDTQDRHGFMGLAGPDYKTYQFLTGATDSANVFTGTAANLSFGNANASGQITAIGNITGSYIIGNGSLLTGLPAGYANANVSSYAETGWAGNIIPSANVTYSLGNPTNRWVSINAGNISAGIITATGNITGGNISTAGIITATGNITGGNISTAGQMNSTGNAVHGNISTAGIISATGNITGGNISTAGIISATGNITGGNLSIGTGIITTGSIINGNANGIGNIGTSSTYFNTVFAKATSAQYADLAEKYTSDAMYEPGTVLVFGGEFEVTQSTSLCDNRVAGVVSTAPAYTMNEQLENGIYVALAGRVPCRVVGTITKGDMLVSSHLPGVATYTGTPLIGTVIGKALENYDSAFVGVIEVVVGRL